MTPAAKAKVAQAECPDCGVRHRGGVATRTNCSEFAKPKDSREVLVRWLDDLDNATHLACLMRHEDANTLDSMSADGERLPVARRDRDLLAKRLNEDSALVARCVRLLSYDGDERLDEMVVWDDFTDSERAQAIQFWAHDIYSSEVFA